MSEEEYKQHILSIMERYAKGQASEADMLELDEWYEKFPPYQQYAAGMSAAEKRQSQDRILRNINQQIYKESIPSAHRSERTKGPLYLRNVLAAALILFALSAGTFYYLRESRLQKTEQLAQDLITPGSNKAFLTLADGNRISLTDAADGNIAIQAGVKISKAADGQLIYEVKESDQQSTSDAYNTIETPHGGQYQVRLPDGSTVWLNAASCLKYPVSFGKRERRVQLTGEGYFEVAKDHTRPFIVATEHFPATGGNKGKKGQEIKVLGTHFNVNAYNDEKDLKTTLLEGSVQVTPLKGSSVVLKPGQQAVNDGDIVQITNINTTYATAWKDGYFRFNEKTLEMGMKEVARWYNVNIRYKNPSLRKELLGGTISKYSNIEQLLKKMELTGAFHFTVKGREIVVE
ncbi:FecR family protein [Olivibacter sp. XZL3]|uniref:FecR family protein n=1 Tax=Olivibacter sp. XZL3 TaxID=1735116 RepID=UPI001416FBCE|nr:FecR domain-containing protein [Olivibacter sp. XZL3]